MKDLTFYNTVSVSTSPFSGVFITKVLIGYLFEKKDKVTIDTEFDGNDGTGILSERVLVSFGLLPPNKKDGDNFGIYQGQNLETVLSYLEGKGGDSKKIADAIKNPTEIGFEENINTRPVDGDRLTGGFNKIYYGIPGCGKSYQVNKIFNKNEYEVFRTTFYPDYSNSDFVGQIIPKVDEEGNVTYGFQEGPFTEALLFALKNPTKKVCLIIEEINRGNASAIFGDIFQLLDRDVNGNSQYEIDNFAIKEYINKKWDGEFDKVFIPSNLWIISTMNTSDQNVYTLDTAFQRRRGRERILNEFGSDNDFSNLFIPGSTCTWKHFVETINRAILNRNPAGLNGEDKQLGVYFVSRNELVNENSTNIEENKKAFVEKVLRYIWDDVSKLDPSQWFISDIKSFDDLVNAFNTKNLKVFKELFDDLDVSNED